MYLIETSVIVGYLRGVENSIELIESLDGDLSSSLVCLCELYEGIYRSSDVKDAEKQVLRFFDGLSEVWGIDEKTAKVFGELRYKLKRRGEVLEDLDILIASTCIACGLTLVTHNKKHFQRVKGLTIY